MDESGKIIDDELELENIQRANILFIFVDHRKRCIFLSNVSTTNSVRFGFNENENDNHPVIPKYIEPLLDHPEDVNECEDLLSFSEHIRQSQYILKKLRCNSNKY